MFETLLLGAGVGLIAVLAPGPVTLALVEIGASRGRRSGARAGLGVAGAELVVSSLALILVLAGAGLPGSALDATQLVSSIFLMTIGAGLLARPGLSRSLVGHFVKPFRSMFAITALNPSVFGAWVALFVAMPFSQDVGRLILFAIGGVSVSVLWHITLGTAAASLSTALSDRNRAGLGRVGGLAMLTFAGWTLF